MSLAELLRASGRISSSIGRQSGKYRVRESRTVPVLRLTFLSSLSDNFGSLRSGSCFCDSRGELGAVIDCVEVALMSLPMASLSFTKGMKPSADRSLHLTDDFSRSRMADLRELSSGRLVSDCSDSDVLSTGKVRRGMRSEELLLIILWRLRRK